MRATCRVSNDTEPCHTQVVREIAYIAGPVPKASTWLIAAVAVAWSVNPDDPNSTLRCSGVVDGEVDPSSWRAVQSDDWGSIGISDFYPSEISAIIELDHLGFGNRSDLVVVHHPTIPPVVERVPYADSKPGVPCHNARKGPLVAMMNLTYCSRCGGRGAGGVNGGDSGIPCPSCSRSS
jgi:hypothetical protein